jgi:hypothetical protein
MAEPDYKQLLLSLIRSLGLADHMGDVAEDVQKILQEIDDPLAKVEWEDLSDLGSKLSDRGIKTVWGS